MAASMNLKNVAVRFTRTLMLKTGKKINHLDSDDSDDSENDDHKNESTLINFAKTLTSSKSMPLLQTLHSELHFEELSKSSTESNLNQFEEKSIFHLDDDFELLPSNEHGTVLFR